MPGIPIGEVGAAGARLGLILGTGSVGLILRLGFRTFGLIVVGFVLFTGGSGVWLGGLFTSFCTWFLRGLLEVVLL